MAIARTQCCPQLALLQQNYITRKIASSASERKKPWSKNRRSIHQYWDDKDPCGDDGIESNIASFHNWVTGIASQYVLSKLAHS